MGATGPLYTTSIEHVNTFLRFDYCGGSTATVYATGSTSPYVRPFHVTPRPKLWR
jgi:hypothetical protein